MAQVSSDGRPDNAREGGREDGLRLEFLGGPRLLHQGEPVHLSALRMALLCVVGSSGPEGVRRSELIRLLWGTEPGYRKRRSLSQTLHIMKAHFHALLNDPVLHADREVIRIPDGVLCTDLEDVRKALEVGDLSAARERLTREYLPELARNRRGLELWADEQRQRFHDQIRDSVNRIVAEADGRADWSRAAEAAELLLLLDPTDEKSLQWAIRWRAAGGQIREAEAAYRSFVERGGGPDEAQDWEPSPDTVELMNTVRTLKPTSQGTDDQPRAEPPLVGRENVLRSLANIVQPPFSDGFEAAVLLGEAGWGKTRLAEEALARAAADGVLTLRGHCSPSQTCVMLGPVLQALNHQTVQNAVHDLHDPWKGVILELLPDLVEPGEKAPPVLRIEEEGAQRRLCEALRVLLHEVARRCPLVLFLEDLHWADQTTRAVIDYVRQNWGNGAVRLMVTARPEELEARPEVRQFVEALRRGGHRLELEALTPTQSQEVVSLMAGNDSLHSQTRDQIVKLAEGSPFFLVELAQEALQGRFPKGSGGERALEPLVTLPESIQQLIDARLDDLGRHDRTILELLAVSDRPLSTDNLTVLAKLPVDDVAWSLRGLVGRRLSRSSEGKHAIAHTLFAHGIYHQIPDFQKADYHRRVGEHLLRSAAPPELARIALHFHQAGDRTRARNYALRAAEQAQDSGAVGEVTELLTVAMQNADDASQDAEIVHRLAKAHHRHRDFDQALHFLRQATPRLRAMNRPGDALLAAVHQVEVETHQDWENRSAYLQRLKEVKGEAATGQHWEALIEAIDIEIRLRDSAADETGVQQVLAEAETYLGQGPAWVDCRLYAAQALHIYFGDPLRGLHASQQAVKLARREGLHGDLLLALNRLLLALINRGELETDEGRDTIRKAQDLAAQSGDLLQRSTPFINFAVWYMDTGRFEEADRNFAQAEEILRHTPDLLLRRILYTNLGELRWHQGYPTDARRCFSKVAEEFGHPALYRYQLLARSGLGLTYFQEGNPEQASTVGPTSSSLPYTRSMDPYLPVAFVARACMHRGDHESAQAWLADTASEAQGRFFLASLKLKLDLVRLFRDVDRTLAAEHAAEGAGMAREKGLYHRASEFEALLDPRRRPM